MRGFLMAVICLMSMLAAAAERGSVEALLDGYEWEINPAGFSRLGADAYRVLLEIARDDEASQLTRARAAAALTLYPNDEVWHFYMDAITTPGTAVQRRRMVEAICETFAGSRLEALQTVLLPLLEHEDAHLRTKVAKCMQTMTTAQAVAALNRYRASINEAWEARAAGFEDEALE